MIKETEFEEAYSVLLSIFEITDRVQKGRYRRNMPRCFAFESAWSLLYVTSNNDDNKVKLRSLNNRHSFIMYEGHRKANVSLKFCYDNGNSIRIGHEYFELSDFTEEAIFQYSTMWDAEMITDLYFYLFLKSKGLKQNFSLKDDAYNLSGLKEILEHIQECEAHIIYD
ncbi:hypothetical protein ACUYQI_000605 [Salmonella enterica subsp. enterica serovar Braenderup]